MAGIVSTGIRGLIAIDTYSPEKVIGLLGVAPIMDFEEIAIKYSYPRRKIYRGTKQEMAVATYVNMAGEITITVNRTSVMNDLFQLCSSTMGYTPVVVKDLMGLSTVVMTKGFLINAPEVVYAKGVTTNAWTFQGVLQANIISGSNALLSTLTSWL